MYLASISWCNVFDFTAYLDGALSGLHHHCINVITLHVKALSRCCEERITIGHYYMLHVNLLKWRNLIGSLVLDYCFDKIQLVGQ